MREKVLCVPNVVHRTSSLHIHVHPRSVLFYKNFGEVSYKIKNDTPSWQKECHGLLCRLINYGGKDFSDREKTIQGIFMELLSILHHHLFLIATKTQAKNLMRPRDMEILAYVASNFTTSLSIPEIAHHFGLNEDYFYRVLKQPPE